MSKATMNTQDAVSANFAECFVTIDGTRYSMLMAKAVSYTHLRGQPEARRGEEALGDDLH